jgi:hypothetical protein
MGIPRPKRLSDLIRLEAHLKVTCPGCGRTGVFPVQDLLAYFRSRGWNAAWDAAGGRFRCEGCGRRGAHLSLAPMERPAAVAVPVPTARALKERQRRARD